MPTPKDSKRAGRVARVDAVAALIREEIVNGRPEPGQRLPTWDVLSRRYAIGRPTLMQVMERLKRDGFVVSDSTRGTFVTDRPPHLSRYALLFPGHPADESSNAPANAAARGVRPGQLWSRFWDALAYQAPLAGRRWDADVRVFFDVQDHASADRARLTDELRRRRLAGLILVGTNELVDDPLLRDAAVPRVAIYDGRGSKQLPLVYVDHASFVDKSLARLAAAGRRRVAVVGLTSYPFKHFAGKLDGLDAKPFWQLATTPAHAANLARLLFDPDNALVPDGLILTDDNIVEPTLAGLTQSGVAVPASLEVVAHCNWPVSGELGLAAHRLGFDSAEVLDACHESLSRQRAGRGVPPSVRVAARWPDELRAGG